ncbi:MAG TPA: DNA-binding protein Alba [Candidatus Saccharimonadales bacterium]|nr:DNA-binding protein Alba [Candidatus Saccharimonadales bacterium]
MAIVEQNLVRVGRKPIMNYVTACVTLFNSGNDEVMVRARGRTIEKAIDIVQMLKRGFLKNVTIQSIDVGSENVKRMDGTRGNISIIEITLSREGDEIYENEEYEAE